MLPTSVPATAVHLTPIAPGIWRLRCGTPERLTPLAFRSAPLNEALLQGLPAVAHPPFAPGEIQFRVSGRGCAIELPMTRDERIYGLGLSTRLFEMTDRRAFIRPSDNPENGLNESHAPVPFYVSTRGYGVFVDTARYASFYTGNVAPMTKAGAAPDTESSPATDHVATTTEELYRARTPHDKTMLIDIPSAHGVDIYLFGGPTLADAVRRYNGFAGGGCVPPLWGLGILYRGKGDFSADDSLALAKSFRENRIPCDMWGVEPGWQTKTYSSSFVWNTAKFPDPDGFIGVMHQSGYRLSFWQHAFTHPSSPMYEALKPISGDYQVWGGLVPDFGGPAARKVFTDHQESVLFSKGVDAVKLDECDNQPTDATPWSFPEASAFPSGLDGEQMHSLFGLLYQQSLWAPLKRRNRRTLGLVRNSHALASSLPYVVYSDSYDHRCYVRGLVNSGFSGLLWVPEVRDAASVEDLLRRVQTVIFAPQAMINCWYMKLPPWLQIDRDKSNNGEMMPDHTTVTDTIRRLFELRMALVPYLYAAFCEYRRTGTPPIRALVMDWPDDSEVHKIDDQFLFGPSLLVAPLFTGQKERGIYLPAGNWFDFSTGKKLAGGRHITVASPIEQVPLFVRDNTLLPLAAPVPNIADDTSFALTVHVYGDHPAPVTLYEDDGISYDYEKGVQNRLVLTWEDGKGSEQRSGSYRGPVRYRVDGWKQSGA